MKNEIKVTNKEAEAAATALAVVGQTWWDTKDADGVERVPNIQEVAVKYQSLIDMMKKETLMLASGRLVIYRQAETDELLLLVDVTGRRWEENIDE